MLFPTIVKYIRGRGKHFCISFRKNCKHEGNTSNKHFPTFSAPTVEFRLQQCQTKTRKHEHCIMATGGGKKKIVKKQTIHETQKRSGIRRNNKSRSKSMGVEKGKNRKKKRKTDLQLINDINRKLASRTNCKSICKIDYPYVYTEGMERAV